MIFSFGETCRNIGKKINEPEVIIPVLAAIGMGGCFLGGYIIGHDDGRLKGENIGWEWGINAATTLYAGDPRLDVPYGLGGTNENA